MEARDKAARLNAEALALEDAGQREQAVARYEQAVAADPAWGTPLFNLGLLYKREKNWAKSLEYNARAMSVEPDNDAACWNLGIAATALARWDVARRAWRGFGIEVPDGEGPVDRPCGCAPIRLRPDGDGEVVWCDRLDPARARISNVPFPESGHRFGDVVLNDGAPNGYRVLHGKQVPVFDALELLQRSEYGTYVARVVLRGSDADAGAEIERLAQLASARGGSAEDWSTSVRVLCRKCSEGAVHADHDRDNRPIDGAHEIGIAATGREQAARMLAEWRAGHPAIEVASLDEALEPRPG